jgi:uncharacterized integral membrane protein
MRMPSSNEFGTKSAMNHSWMDRMMDIKLVFILLLAFLAAVFIAQNVGPVEVRFLYWTVTTSSAMLIFSTLLFGFVLGCFLHGFMLHRQRNKQVYLR